MHEKYVTWKLCTNSDLWQDIFMILDSDVLNKTPLLLHGWIYAMSFRRFDMHFAIERIEVNFADNRSEHLSRRSINVSYWIHVTGWWIGYSLKLPWQVHALDSTPDCSYFNTCITFQFFKLCILMALIVFAFLIFRFKFFWFNFAFHFTHYIIKITKLFMYKYSTFKWNKRNTFNLDYFNENPEIHEQFISYKMIYALILDICFLKFSCLIKFNLRYGFKKWRKKTQQNTGINLHLFFKKYKYKLNTV